MVGPWGGGWQSYRVERFRTAGCENWWAGPACTGGHRPDDKKTLNTTSGEVQQDREDPTIGWEKFLHQSSHAV
jgi:hypothetical protein